MRADLKRWGGFCAGRERDPNTHAISLVISRGFGTHVRLTLWWWWLAYHRRDSELERKVRALMIARGEAEAPGA